ncbi:MAG: exodeoxyribonuclease VII large subunit [Verrucomicrobiales bacterium]
MKDEGFLDLFDKPEPEPEIKVLTVTQLTRKIRNLLELKIGSVTLEGEISNLRKQSSGHVYFTLKDTGAQVSCVLFRSDAKRVRIDLKDGIEIQLKGEISVYEPRGQYQIIGRRVQAVGQGALQVQFDALKQKLNSEGLFDTGSKRSIPRFPHTICLVTSPTGAALRDMLNILARRAPWVRVLIWPVRVQGDAAAGEIADAVTQLSDPAAIGLPAIDTLVVTRGGGSLEDLWPFNEEIVARAIHACTIPVVSAVGHEIDFTISDFTADLRAPTPSAAAELIVPDGADLSARIDGLSKSLDLHVEHTLGYWETVLDHTARSALTREPLRVLDEFEQDLDHLEATIESRAEAQLKGYERELREVDHALQLCHPGSKLERQWQALALVGEKLEASFRRQFAAQEARLDHAATALKALGPESIFARGFSATTDSDGKLVTSPDEAPSGTKLTTYVEKGSIHSTVD